MRFLKYGIFIIAYYSFRAIFLFTNLNAFYILFLNVGQGDSAVINIPRYGPVLIDTGEDYQSNYLTAKKYIFPFCRIKSIFITHYDSDHSEGLGRHVRFCKNVTIYDNLSRGDSLIFPGVSIRVLGPLEKNNSHQDNDDSLVLFLESQDLNVLFSGDAGLRSLLKSLPVSSSRVDVYKVSHHGSSHNNSFELIKELKAKYCVISVGKNNYGHPSREVIDDLERAGCTVYRTDLDGTIMIY